MCLKTRITCMCILWNKGGTFYIIEEWHQFYASAKQYLPLLQLHFKIHVVTVFLQSHSSLNCSSVLNSLDTEFLKGVIFYIMLPARICLQSQHIWRVFRIIYSPGKLGLSQENICVSYFQHFQIRWNELSFCNLPVF